MTVWLLAGHMEERQGRRGREEGDCGLRIGDRGLCGN